MIGLVAATGRGRGLAEALLSRLADARCYEGAARDALGRAWAECDAVVLFMATGAAVRLCAPLLADKRTDPAVVTVDDAGRFAVALCGGHAGANELAETVAVLLGGHPVITTASEALGYPALDSLGSDLGFELDSESDVAAVGAALAGGCEVGLVEDHRWPLPALPPGVVRRQAPAAPCLIITDREVDPPRPSVVYRPKTLVAGVGCSRGAGSQEILELIGAALCDAGLSPASIAHLSSIDLKGDERGLLDAAARLGVPLRFHPASALREIPVPSPSEDVRTAVGTPSVAEAAVIASGAELATPKRKSSAATVAIGCLHPRGLLHVVGVGPGNAALIPELAKRALARSEVIVGLRRYIDQVAPLLRPGARVEASDIGDEVLRAELAVREASCGKAVALVSGGDAGVYAMASPALERVPEGVDVVCVPGVTAAVAAAALLGAPLGHDHASISLSDLLTPWELIRARVEAAAAADMVVAFYNPRSRARAWQLGEARDILLAHRRRDTPVGVVSDAYRNNERVELTTLGDLDVECVGMTTTVVIGNSRTRIFSGRMVTPRGYR
ncbi:MAG TPA: precorrin-3B C(17)-methyltransferase [Actinomycetota bacterium]|nr:precorrin-3B C(17)-methyltransferase [Actinomycetota bacterium]